MNVVSINGVTKMYVVKDDASFVRKVMFTITSISVVISIATLSNILVKSLSDVSASKSEIAAAIISSLVTVLLFSLWFHHGQAMKEEGDKLFTENFGLKIRLIGEYRNSIELYLKVMTKATKKLSEERLLDLQLQVLQPLSMFAANTIKVYENLDQLNEEQKKCFFSQLDGFNKLMGTVLTNVDAQPQGMSTLIQAAS